MQITEVYFFVSKSSPHFVHLWALSDSSVKISAGWLIEKCGFKGRRVKDVGIYEKQALVIINYGNATGSEIFEFSEQIILEVYNQFNIELVKEVNIL